MELIKDTINVCNISAKGVTQAMADGDVIVPDVKPDILKLLQVDAQACVTDKYIENGRLVICGRVDYKILYVPDSENEKIKSIMTSMDFRQVVDAGGADNNAKIIVKPVVEKVEFNTVNSRKLRIRTILEIEYEICTIKQLDIVTDIASDEIEKEYMQISFEDTTDISEHSFTISERLEVPAGTEAVCEILKTDVKIYDTEYKALSGKVIVKGNTGVCVLYSDTDGNLRFLEEEIPFTEILDAEGIGEESLCDIDYMVIGGMSNIEPDNDGDMRVISIDIDMCVSLKAGNVAMKDTVKDCYMPYKTTRCNKEKITLKTTVERPCVQNTVREVVELPKNVPGISGIYNVMANTNIIKSELQKNKILCEGNLEVYILYLSDSAESPVYSYKKEIPFSYMIDCENDTENLLCEMKSTIRHINYNLNSNGQIELRCGLEIDCVLQEEKVFDNISHIAIDDKESEDGIVVCFAEKGETVWDIAKRYCIPQESLLRHNELDCEAMGERTRLFIPVR